MAKRPGIFGNLETKIMALIMAAVLYVYATSERSSEEGNVSVPLGITLPASTTTIEKPPEQIRLSFVGPQKAIEKLREVRNQIEVKCVVDDKGHEDDNQWTTSVVLDAESISNVPREVAVSRIDPNTFNLTIARTVSKELKVRLQLTGEPSPGLELSRMTPPYAYPGTITVMGPKTVISRATEIRTRPVSLSDLPAIPDLAFSGKVGMEQTVEIKVDNQVKHERIECSQVVEYWITLTQVRESLALKKLLVKILKPPNFPFVARPIQSQETVDVELKGLKQALSKLDASNVIPYVDVTDQRPSRANLPMSLPVRFALPDEVQGKVEVVNEPPKFVGVDITEPPAKEKGTTPPGRLP